MLHYLMPPIWHIDKEVEAMGRVEEVTQQTVTRRTYPMFDSRV
jgi:hypothetical protein